MPESFSGDVPEEELNLVQPLGSDDESLFGRNRSAAQEIVTSVPDFSDPVLPEASDVLYSDASILPRTPSRDQMSPFHRMQEQRRQRVGRILRSARMDLKPTGGYDLKKLIGRIETSTPRPERKEDETYQEYFRGVFALKEEEAEQLAKELEARRIELINQHIGDVPALKQIEQEVAFQRWRFTGKPGDPLPECVVYDVKKRLTISLPLLTRTQDIADKYSKIISERTCEFQFEDVTREAQRATRAYTFLDSLQRPVNEKSLKEVPLSPLAILARSSELRRQLSREHGIRENEVENPASAQAVPAHERYRRDVYRLESTTEQQFEKDEKQVDPYARLRSLMQQEIAEEVSDGCIPESVQITGTADYPTALDPNTPEGSWIITGMSYIDVIKRYTDGDRSVPDVQTLFKNIVNDALRAEGKKFMSSYSENLEASFKGFHISANRLYGRAEVSPALLEKLVWMREPAFDEDEVASREQLPTYSSKTMLTNERSEELKQKKLAALVEDNRSREERERHQLIQLQSEDDLPEITTDAVVMKLRFDNDPETNESYLPKGLMPNAPGFLTVAKRKTADGIEFDFIRADEDPYRKCDVSIGMPSVASNYFYQQGMHVIDEALHDHHGDVSVHDLERIISENSVYLLPSSPDLPSVIVEDGYLFAQCKGGNSVFAESCNKSLNVFVSAREIGGLVIVPGENSISMLGHAQTEVTANGQRYICDATPRISLNNSQATQNLQLSHHVMNKLGIDDLQNNSTKPKQSQNNEPEKRPESEPEFLAQHETPDMELLARQYIAGAPAKLHLIKEEFEESMRIRLGVEKDPRYKQADVLYKHLLMLVPNKNDPLRMTASAIISAANHDVDAQTLLERKGQCRDALARIAYYKKYDAMQRKKVSAMADAATLAVLEASGRALMAQIDRLEWAYNLLKTDGAEQQS